MVHKIPNGSDMRVTGIRFERELIDKLKTLAGKLGYQSLVRDVLWDYVRQHSDDPGFPYSVSKSGRLWRLRLNVVSAAF